MRSSGRVATAHAASLHRPPSHCAPRARYDSTSNPIALECTDASDDMSQTCGDPMLRDAFPASRAGLWTPSTAIVFAPTDTPRLMRKDFTWKRGDQIIFGPTLPHQHARSFSTKKPAAVKPSAPAVPAYQPRQKKSLGDVANPNDLSFLGSSLPKPRPKPVHARTRTANPIDTPASAASAPSESLSASTATSGSSTPPTFTFPSQSEHPSPVGPAAAPPPGQSDQSTRSDERLNDSSTVPTPPVNLTPEQQTQDALKFADLRSTFSSPDQQHEHNERAHERLRRALLAMDAHSRSQQMQIASLHLEHKQKLDSLAAKNSAEEAQRERTIKALNKRISEYDTRLVKLPHDWQTTLDEIKSVKDASNLLRKREAALLAENQRLRADLEHERDPSKRQSQRLSKLQESRIAEEERENDQQRKRNRAAQRANYEDFKSVFSLLKRDVRVFEIVDLEAQVRLEQRAMKYWKEAYAGFELFVSKVRGKRTPGLIDLQSDARRQRRNAVFRTLFQHLQESLASSATTVSDLDDRKFELTTSTSMLLKSHAHDVRRYLRHLRLHQGRSPGMSAQELSADAIAMPTAAPMRDLAQMFYVQLWRLKRDLNRRHIPSRKLAQQYQHKDTVGIQLDLLELLRELDSSLSKARLADWMQRQSLANAAALSIRPMMTEEESMRRNFTKAHNRLNAARITTKQQGLTLMSDHWEIRRLLDELQEINFRNVGLAEKHGQLSDNEKAKLNAFVNGDLKRTWGRLGIWLEQFRSLDLRPTLDMLRSLQAGDLRRVQVPEPASIIPIAVSAPVYTNQVPGSRKQDTRVSQPTTEGPISNEDHRRDRLVKPEIRSDAVAVLKEQPVVFNSPMDVVVAKNPAPVEPSLDTAEPTDNTAESADSVYKPILAPGVDDTAVADIVASLDVVADDAASLDVDAEFDDLESGMEMNYEAPPGLQRPRYKHARKALHASRGATSSKIQPRRGVLPPPDYSSRTRRRSLVFRPTKPRKHGGSTGQVDISERVWMSGRQRSEIDGANLDSLPDLSSGRDTRVFNVSATSKVDDQSPEKPLSNQVIDKTPPKAKTQAHVPLTYQIPADHLRAAFLASKTSGAAFWKHTLYKGPGDEKIKIHYCTKFDQAEKQAKLFLDESVLGFDLEWEAGAKVGTASIKENVSLIQIASEDRIGLFQIASFNGDTPEVLMPPSLRAILESPSTVKAGVNISGDFTRLRKCFGIDGQGLFEISHLYKVVKYYNTDIAKIDRKQVKLADQVQDVLYLPLAKGAVRTSSWSRRLSAEQIEYAATDAYAGFRLYDALEAKRKAMVPVPPRPALYELHMPLVPDADKLPGKETQATTPTLPDLVAVIQDQDADQAAANGLDDSDGDESSSIYHSCDSDDAGAARSKSFV